jgi:UDP-3-O-[3-hydroxymyristoyl] glucosamine N-acyltransferase
VPHVGDVVIGDGVEIGAGTCIDRAKLGSTTIGDGTKIDNLVQIGHNCEIGRSCIICGCSGLAGSVKLGDGVTIAANVGIADNLQVGDGATVGARAGVMDNIPAGEAWVGIPARPARETMKILAATKMLPEALRRLRSVEQRHRATGDQGK